MRAAPPHTAIRKGAERRRASKRRQSGTNSQYLASAYGLTFYTAKRKHVRMFMNHLAKPGGPQPHESRPVCLVQDARLL
jgi:hypothetical protein